MTNKTLLKFFCILYGSVGIFLFVSCAGKARSVETKKNENLIRARTLLDSVYQIYSVPYSYLLRENYPFDEAFESIYSEPEIRKNTPKQYAYLWSYSESFSAVNALFEAGKDERDYTLLRKKVLPGLEEYFDTIRTPFAYASYINSSTPSDRYYDDNIWIGIDFVNIYKLTKNTEYLEKAKLIWKFVLSGIDNVLGGGIYWCEQGKKGKNTCSSASGSVYAFNLFEVTNDSTYFYKGKELYDWTKMNLQDTTDDLYFDNINLKGKVGKAKYAYNSGQMMLSAVLQYKLTQKTVYIEDARRIAKSCYNYFFIDYTADNGEKFRLLKKGDVWFAAVMLRGFIELYHLDKDPTYINAFNKSLDYAWFHSRDQNGLFNADYTGKDIDQKKWLLTQVAMAEMYARIALLRLRIHV